MTFVSIHTLDGDPDELIQRKHARMDPTVRELAPEYGAILSLTVRRADGLTVINVWESAQQAAAFTQLPRVQAAQQMSELPAPSAFERFTEAELDVFRLLSPGLQSLSQSLA